MTEYKSGYPTGELWAVIDPGWGEPFPVLDTISTSPEESKRLGCISPHISLYSGASNHSVPPIPGEWKRLTESGYTVRRVSVMIDSP